MFITWCKIALGSEFNNFEHPSRVDLGYFSIFSTKNSVQFWNFQPNCTLNYLEIIFFDDFGIVEVKKIILDLHLLGKRSIA